MQNHRLKSRMLMHTGERPFKCKVCDASFGDRSNITSHMRTHTDGQPFQCDFCGASFGLVGNLKRHRSVKHTWPTV